MSGAIRWETFSTPAIRHVVLVPISPPAVAARPRLPAPTVVALHFIGVNDNPKRPRHRLWFGPMTMIQYISDTGLLPGTAHDISMVAAKLGVAGALQDIQLNHPNDLVSLIMFSRPHYSGEPTEVGQFSIAQVPLTNNYTALSNGLWYPPNSSTADVRPWDPNGMQTPRAHGDYNANTATDYGFMLAYNQLNANPALVSSGMGGLGAKGAENRDFGNRRHGQPSQQCIVHQCRSVSVLLQCGFVRHCNRFGLRSGDFV